MQTKTEQYHDWEDAIWASPGETVKFYVAFGNDGDTPSLRNCVVVSLPASLGYCAGSCRTLA